MTAPLDDWLVAHEASPSAAVRLICFAHAGGSAVGFGRWRPLLPARIELCPVELPGHWARLQQTPFTDLSTCVTALGAALQPFWEPRPFALFGYSLGALVAFELSRWLQARALPAARCLFVAAACAPQATRTLPRVHTLPEAQFVAHMAQTYGGIPAAILREPDMLQAVVRPLRADMQMLETYTYAPGALLQCPIQPFGGTEDKLATPQHLQHWAQHTQTLRPPHVLPGGHFFINDQLSAVLETIVRELIGSAP